MLPAVVLAVVAFIAGKPATAVCNVDGYPGTAPPGFTVEAWTQVGGDLVHLAPSVCAALQTPPGTVSFARGLRVVIHESAHARGVSSESCAETWADLTVYDVLRRFYRVEFFTPLSAEVGGQVYAETLRRPSDYQPSLTACG